ncbi:MAG: transcriptional regulator [Candidatus Curtissbacteria bacterium GW2011_GWC2_38_9]|uniref:Transcriptional regulator n=1 Tax=Candidatus Curtissbacteria bacterium GW2011_GWC2_38_9 TaxID=1618414 RepID=A0A0G0LA54_9BACT|nr:MAG: transcriptional regulator [Candidatus Curtissbacteria bacterium GW2011_GWC2_38_9]
MGNSVYSREYQNVIKRLKEARIESGLKQEEVAERLGKPQSYVSKIERGERRVDIAEVKLFAKLYQKPIDFFVK